MNTSLFLSLFPKLYNQLLYKTTDEMFVGAIAEHV